MINLARVGNNVLTLMILVGIGYMIYQSITQKNPRFKDKLRGFMGMGDKK